MNKTGKFNIFNTILLIIVSLIVSASTYAQGSEEKAIKLFEEGQYREALPHFKELNRLYPGEAAFQYYYGVCLTETDQYSDEARTLLLHSMQGDVPDNVYFYIGKNYHALNDFDNAASYYSRFDNYARRREKRALSFNEIESQLQHGINPFVSNEKDEEKPIIDQIEKETAVTSDTVSTSEEIVSSSNEVEESETTDIRSLEIPPVLEEKNINFILTPELKYLRVNQFKTFEGKQKYINGWKKSLDLENTLHTLHTLRENYQQETNPEKQQEIAEQMLEMELSSIRIKAESDESFLLARSSEMEFWNGAPANAISKLKHENDSIFKSLIIEPSTQLSTSITEIEQTDTSEPEPENGIEENIEIEENNELKKDNNIQTPSVNAQTNNIVYKVQIGAYSRGLPEYIDRLYQKIAVLRRIDNYTSDNGVVVYTIGELTNYDDALSLQQQIRQEGIKDAFVVAFNNGKRITLSEARELTQP